MGNIINFMERLGASAEYQELSEAEVLEMLQQQNIVQSKISEFHSGIECLLDARKNLVCGLAPAEEPADEPAKEQEPEEDEENSNHTK